MIDPMSSDLPSWGTLGITMYLYIQLRDIQQKCPACQVSKKKPGRGSHAATPPRKVP